MNISEIHLACEPAIDPEFADSCPPLCDREAAILSQWYAAVAIEPALVDLEFAIRAMRVDQDDPDFWPHYSAWKMRLTELVGWYAAKPELRGSGAYEACFDYLLAVFEGRA